uniref:Myb/SANT-like domain-containing protein n=1 Tax=Leersia perrieri TaxID=77586 RepID=A0A0D9WFT9_9ORYZ
MGSPRPKRKREQSNTLDSSEGSSNSLLSDTESGQMEEDDVEVVSKALTDIAVKSPEAIHTFVGRLTPIIVVWAIDWDDLESNKLSKILILWRAGNAAGQSLRFGDCNAEHHWINPKIQGFHNLIRKMHEHQSKNVNMDNVRYIWKQCRKRFTLESKATGLGRDPCTGSIIVPDTWWAAAEKIWYN